MEFWIKAGQLLLSLSILIVLHELGHYIPAKLFKTRIEKFYLFFDPWFSLFKKKIGETTWGIGWLPLGGYVKISGMIDESMDKEQMAKDPEPWEFRAKPAWQRLIIMLGGVTVNVLLGYFIFILVLFSWGEDKLPLQNMTYGVHLSDSTLYDAGFREGDKILAMDGKEVETIGDVSNGILIDDKRDMKVERDGEIVEFTLPQDIHTQLLGKGIKEFFAPRMPVIIKDFPKNSTAKEAGFKEKDSLVSINGNEAVFFQDFTKVLQDNKGEKIDVGLYRDGEYKELAVKVDKEDGTIGFYPENIDRYFEIETTTYGFFESIPAGISKGNEILGKYVKSLSLLFTKEGASQIGGFGAIGGMFSPVWDWQSFWYLTAFLSMILAFMNILPIPALDGGHVMFLLYELITGRKPHEKAMEYAQMIGMIFLLGLLLYANGMDIVRGIFGE